VAKKSGTDTDAGSLPAGFGNNVGELEVLRDLIFGNQARDFTRRLGDLENRLESVRRELKGEQETRTQSVAKTAADQTLALRKEAHSRIDKEVQVIGERLEQLSADLREHIDATRRAVETRLDRMEDDTAERLRLLEEAARERDDDLRSELLTLSAWLEDKKTSRHDLGRMLEEIGQRLQANAQAGAGDESDEA
jgi:hypothetical protein